MKDYETEENRQLFLWKEEDIIGLIGVLFHDDQNAIEILHVSVNPSHRFQGVGKRMVKELKEMYADKEIISNKDTASFIEKCDLC